MLPEDDVLTLFDFRMSGVSKVATALKRSAKYVFAAGSADVNAAICQASSLRLLPTLPFQFVLVHTHSP